MAIQAELYASRRLPRWIGTEVSPHIAIPPTIAEAVISAAIGGRRPATHTVLGAGVARHIWPLVVDGYGSIWVVAWRIRRGGSQVDQQSWY